MTMTRDEVKSRRGILRRWWIHDDEEGTGERGRQLL